MAFRITALKIIFGIFLIVALLYFSFFYIPYSYLVIIPLFFIIDIIVIVKSITNGRSFPTFFTSDPYADIKTIHKKDKPLRFWMLIIFQIVFAIISSIIFILLIYFSK